MVKLSGKPHYRIGITGLWVLTDIRWFPQFPITLNPTRQAR